MIVRLIETHSPYAIQKVRIGINLNQGKYLDKP